MNRGTWVAIAVAVVVAIGVGAYTNAPGTGNAATVSDEGLPERVAPMIIGDVAAFRLLDEPVDLSELTFNDRNGEPKSLSAWKGRTVLVNLWATWCAPCREEMPELEELNDKLGGGRFEVVPISIDAGEAVKPLDFYRDTGLETLPFYHDGSMATFAFLKKAGLAFGMPTTVLIDRDGFARGVLNGPARWASSDAVALVEEAIGPVR